MRRVGATVAVVAAVALIAVLVGAVLPSGGGSFSTRALAPASSKASAARAPRIGTIFGSDIPARRYGTIIAHLENGGTNLHGQLVSELSPVSPARFRAPIAAYRAYAVRWSAATATAVSGLRRALVSSTREGARAAWLRAWLAYLHLGAVYGMIGALDARIDGLPGELGRRSFAGLHRIELGLWSAAAPPTLAPVAAALARNVARLPRAIKAAKITPLDYATRAHEILEDAQRDLLSGLDVPWSGAGVAGTAAAVAATQEVIGTLAPLMAGRDNTLIEVQNELSLLSHTLAHVRRAHGERLPTLAQLALGQREALDAAMAGALSQLDQVPGTLETSQPPPTPRLP